MSPPPESEAHHSVQPEWPRLFDEWRKLLAQCIRKPSRKHVHTLRSFTLRLGVAVEYWLHVQTAGPVAARASRRWKKEGKKLRRALQPVRDADVYLARLDGLRSSLAATPESEAKLQSRSLRQIDKLEKRLRRQHKTGVDRLIAVTEVCCKRLNQLSREMETALIAQAPSSQGSTASAALHILAELAGEFPALDSTNLHAYRKRLKPALYLSEISSANDPLAKKLSVAFKTTLQAVGEWHDWQTLTLKADRVFPGHSRQNGLLPLLETQTKKALQKALDLCGSTATRLLTDTHRD